MNSDGIKWTVEARVDKYTDEQTAFVSAKTGILAPVGDDLRKFCAVPEDGTAYAHGNLLTTVGLTAITALLIGTGGSGKLYNLKSGSPSTNAAMGVGASTIAANPADTQLGSDGGSAAYQVMDNTYPTVAAGVITGQCSYQTGFANFAWNEWGFVSGTGTVAPATAPVATIGTGLFGTAASYALWNHKIQSLGTKSSGTWVLVSTVTLQ